MKLHCYYVPTATSKIASTTEILRHCKGETITMTDKYLTISGNAMHPAVQVPYVGGLPTARIYKMADKSLNYMVGRSWKPEDVQRFDTGREDGGLDMKDPMNWRESPGDLTPPSRRGVVCLIVMDSKL